MKYSIKKIYFGVFLVVGIAVGVAVILPKFNGEEREILENLRKANGCNRPKIHLSDLLPKHYYEICFQPPYMQQKAFENQSKHTAPNFIATDDHRAYWWLYGEGGKTLTIEIPRFEIPEKTLPPPKRCYLVKETMLAFSCEESRALYYFEELK